MVENQFYKIRLSPIVSSPTLFVEYLGEDRMGKAFRVIKNGVLYKKDDLIRLREPKILSNVGYVEEQITESPYVEEVKEEVIAKKPLEPVPFTDGYTFGSPTD